MPSVYRQDPEVLTIQNLLIYNTMRVKCDTSLTPRSANTTDESTFALYFFVKTFKQIIKFNRVPNSYTNKSLSMSGTNGFFNLDDTLCLYATWL